MHQPTKPVSIRSYSQSNEHEDNQVDVSSSDQVNHHRMAN